MRPRIHIFGAEALAGSLSRKLKLQPDWLSRSFTNEDCENIPKLKAPEGLPQDPTPLGTLNGVGPYTGPYTVRGPSPLNPHVGKPPAEAPLRHGAGVWPGQPRGSAGSREVVAARALIRPSFPFFRVQVPLEKPL